jgi:hypothetical protein
VIDGVAVIDGVGVGVAPVILVCPLQIKLVVDSLTL